MALFPGQPRWAGARRELLDFMVHGKINRGRHINHPAGRHSIRMRHCRGWGPTVCRQIRQRPRCCGARLVVVSTRYLLYVSSDRRRRRAASVISPQPRCVHRLGRRHAVAHNCHCAIVLLSSSTTAQCATMFATTRNVGQCPTCMVALPNIGGALCSTPQSLAYAHY